MGHCFVARVNMEQGDISFTLLAVWGQSSLRGWAWNVTGAKSVGGQPRNRIASIQSAWAQLPTIWFDSRMDWDWATHIRGVDTDTQDDSSFYYFYMATKTQKQGFGLWGVSGLGGSSSLVAFGGRGRLRRRSFAVSPP
ncbi:hypothetical protein LX36DRAFT_43725 [Colletotrichum falcatum]|nr:hypothetical protein LX36DRAFT_43725 [Colletotrichum falcatum]